MELVNVSATWQPVQQIVDALDTAFNLAFENVEPVNKPILLGLDVSSSMTMGSVGGVEGLSPREASAALALVIARTEPKHAFMAFTSRPVDIAISPKMRLDDVVKKISNLPFGGTDCALPMLVALKNEIRVEGFVVMTDNETWAGAIHPSQALVKYRTACNVPDAKLAVLAMTSTEFTIASPDDAGMLDVCGLDSSTPQLITEFLKGNV